MFLDPYVRTAWSPVTVPETPAAETPASLLKTARWHAGLSQADVAQRAQITQPAVARYEAGLRTPTLDMLRRLLAACGMRLDLALTPEPGLIDKPTRDLLARPPWERLPEEFQRSLEELVPTLRELGMPFLLADRVAARLRGALVRVLDLEFWIDEADVDITALESALEGIGANLWPRETAPSFGAGRVPRLERLEGGFHKRELRFRGVPRFADQLKRAVSVDLPVGSVLLPSLNDTSLYWPRRDCDRLALQRAERLRQELVGPDPL